MNDPILEGFIKDFAKKRGLPHDGSDLPLVFESFTAYSILRKYHQLEVTDVAEEVLVAGGNDGGIDGMAILVNGGLVRDANDFDAIVDRGTRNLVEYVFIQSKSSSSFRAADIGNFLFGVEQFFERLPQITLNANILCLKSLSDHIFENNIRLQENPNLHLYYASSGTWNDDNDPALRLREGHDRLVRKNLFSKVVIRPIDASSLKSTYREQQIQVEKEIEFSQSATFPDIEGVEQAFIGILSGEQFIDLVSRDDGELNRELFYHNVRDFQGANEVNEEIHETVSSDNRKSFPLFNNGVTVVARSIQRIGNRFVVSGPQIVNGCQTTHVLHLNRKNIDKEVFVPIKLVATDRSEIVANIIKANNRQTAIIPDAWASLTQFHKELEDYYRQNTFEHKSDRIYYERRSKQYLFDSEVSQANVITLSRQIQAFIGMFMGEPHSHHRYYGELLRAYENRIFAVDHRLEPYYASGVALLAVERLAHAVKLFDPELLHYKYHILMLMRLSIAGRSMPKLNSRQIGPYARKIVDKLRSPEDAKAECEGAMKLVRHCLRSFQPRNQRNPPHRLVEFTNVLLKSATSRETRFRRRKHLS